MPVPVQEGTAGHVFANHREALEVAAIVTSRVFPNFADSGPDLVESGPNSTVSGSMLVEVGQANVGSGLPEPMQDMTGLRAIGLFQVLVELGPNLVDSGLILFDSMHMFSEVGRV